jgi:predicted ATPase/DNA-binding winged helix-turn-helix (wHTH) protein
MMRIENLTIFPDRREVLVDDTLVELGSRAMDVLLILMEANGALVTKEELIDRVWPTTIVVDNNLHVHICQIRKIMGVHRKLLVAVPGRGYRLLRSAEPAQATSTFIAVAHSKHTANSLPFSSAQLVGRDTSLTEIGKLLCAHDVMTLVGAGGIGKSSLAAEVGRRHLSQFEGRVWMVEMAGRNTPCPLPAAVASAMGFTSQNGEHTAKTVIDLIDKKPTLLILDNCEHVIAEVAEFTHMLTRLNPGCKILATSREALRIHGERLYHVIPLEVPRDDDSNASIPRRSAVQLFLARVSSIEPCFCANNANLALAGRVCKRLDGVPLAIELAAARAAILGIEVLAEKLDESIRILGGGHRTALPHHQTLEASFDWSYNLLSETERKVLSRLGVLRGAFTLEDAQAVAASDDLSVHDVTEAICALISKSLVVAHLEQGHVEYRLLETTRCYALQRLEANGQRNATERRRARYLSKVFCASHGNWTNEARSRVHGDNSSPSRQRLLSPGLGILPLR